MKNDTSGNTSTLQAHVLSFSDNMSGHTNIIGCEVIQLAKDTTLLTEIGGGVIALKDTSGLECTSTLDAQNLIFSQDTTTDIQSTIDSEAVLLKNDTSGNTSTLQAHVLSLSDTFGHTNTVGCEVIQLAKDTTLLTEIGGGVIALKDTSGLECTSTLDAQNLIFSQDTTTDIQSTIDSEAVLLKNDTSGNTSTLQAHVLSLSDTFGHTNTVGCEVIQLAKDTTLLTEIGGGVIELKDTSGLECTSTLDAQNLIFTQDTHTDIQSTIDSEAVTLKNDTSGNTSTLQAHVLSFSDNLVILILLGVKSYNSQKILHY